MIVAGIALFVALGGVAVAVVGLNHKQKRQVHKIANAAVTRRAPGLSVANAATVGGVKSGDLVVGRSATGGLCDPESAQFINCVTVTLNLPHPGRVLLNAAATAATRPPSAGGNGSCRFGADNAVVGEPFFQSQGASEFHRISSTAVTEPLPAGAHIFQFGCNQGLGEIAFTSNTLSAVLIGAG
jgi:hypothetical protein